jgi:hypothetical protein
MSKYASGLRRRLAGGTDLQKTSEWFIKCMANEPKIQKADFTPLELTFYNDIVKVFVRWKKINLSFANGIIERYLRLTKLHRVR